MNRYASGSPVAGRAYTHVVAGRRLSGAGWPILAWIGVRSGEAAMRAAAGGATMRGSRKSQALALIALAAIPPPVHGADFSLALFWLGRGVGMVVLCGLTIWLLSELKRAQ
jgi:hypothetical protein